MMTNVISDLKDIQIRLLAVPDKARLVPAKLRTKRDDAMNELRSGAITQSNRAQAVFYAFETSALSKAEDAIGRASALPLFERVADNVEELMASARASVTTPAIADYDTLNVKQVVAALSAISYRDALKVRAYETANKNRKTVLNALSGLL